jgi:site-specific DNA recombinase
LLEEAVWDDVCAVLTDPQKVEEEYRRRLDGGDRSSRPAVGPSLDKLIRKVRRCIARLIDAYADGLVEKSEFEPRLRDARERLERLQADAKEQADHGAQEQGLRLVVGRLQEFADQVRDGLQKADWHTQRAIIRAVVKRIEVEAETIRVVYRISPGSMNGNVDLESLQGCWRRQSAPLLTGTRPATSRQDVPPATHPTKSGTSGSPPPSGPEARWQRGRSGRARDSTEHVLE